MTAVLTRPAPTAPGFALVGELVGRSIVLFGTGPVEAQAAAARRLELLTPNIETLCTCGHPAGEHLRGHERCACHCGCPRPVTAALTCPLAWGTVVQLAATFGAAWRPGPNLTAWVTDEMGRRGAAQVGGGELSFAIPAELTARGIAPRDYQVSGAQMIGLVGSAILADEPGTGKTPTTILGLREREARGHPVLPIIVVAPTAVVDSWLEHFRDWAPDWRVTAWRGSPKTRVRKIGTADVYVTSYDVARRDASTADKREVAKGLAPLLSIGARSIVADEVHKIKGQATGQSWAVRRLAAAPSAVSFVGLSGTPITHHPGDLWPALYCLAPGAWPSRERWIQRYCITVAEEYSSTVLGLDENREPEFRTTIVGQFRRVAKQDVLASLPPKVYSVRRVELPKRYRDAYDTFENEMLAELPDSEELEAMTVLSQMGRLIQLASSACDVTVTYEEVEDELTGLPVQKKHQKVSMRAPSWKVDELLSILEERGGPQGGTQVAVFAPSRQLMVLAGETAKAKGYRVGYVIGVGPLVTTGPDAEDLEAAGEPVVVEAGDPSDEPVADIERSRGVTMATRRADVAAFQRGELDVIFVTTGAGGVGLTLTAASTEVFLARPWSLVESIQAEDRCHRIGSERHECIEIIDVVAVGTIETRIREVLVDRGDQLSELVQDRRIVEQLLGGADVRDLRKHSAHETAAAIEDRERLALET